MKVIAANGSKCPKEGNPREYITDSEAVDVPETAYYKRLIKDGSLTVQTVQAAQTVETVSKKEGGKK